MRLKTRTWIVVSLLLFMAAGLFWHWGNQRAAREKAGAQPETVNPDSVSRAGGGAASFSPDDPRVGSFFGVVATNAPNGSGSSRQSVFNQLAYRVSNTQQPLEDLVRNEHAVLLRNALIDTDAPNGPVIPAHLRAAEPGSYIVQGRGTVSGLFQDWLRGMGARVVSYVPNNAFLVRASAGVAQRVGQAPEVQAVLPFEPYYKLDALLLPLAVKQELSPHGRLNVVGFAGETEGLRQKLEALGATVLRAPEPVVFGEVLVVKAPADALVAIAQLSEVQMVGVHFDKGPVNDLSRVKLRVSTNTTNAPIASHYAAPTASGPLNLTGNGVLVAVADTGVDKTHPDLAGRVFGLTTDFDGHGTHVVGSLLGDGTQSSQVASNAAGSTNGANFSGIAPRARAFVQDLIGPDSELQQKAALTNALISNNSWAYPRNDYDIFAASYDAAVRDSLPGVTGEQEVAYVFAAGNQGGGSGDGLNGIAGSILSPATAKNVITVGASDQARFISNLVYRACVTDTNTGVTVCETNQPWLGETDSDNQISGYSARGNVGIGLEGPFGRFKPDVIAPGSMVVSTRSKDYQEPNGSTNTSVFAYNFLPIARNATNLYSLNIPPEAIEVTIQTLPNASSQPTNFSLLIGAEIDNIPTVTSATNTLTLNTANGLTSGTLYYIVANPFHSNTVIFDLVVRLTYTNDVGNRYDELRKLNGPLQVGQHGYRYESGTSMAAPKIAGMLAQFQEYLGTNFNLRPSPALLKALVINGARSLNLIYNLDARAPINHQGWGLANISNSIPSGVSPATTNGPMRFFDQNVTNALATGGTHVYEVTVPDEARSYPLRMTLVWSDPPGNPISSVKLVNDLNLTVEGEGTNTAGTTTNLWAGNNFPSGSDFTQPIVTGSSDTNASASTNLVRDLDLVSDRVNNVENVYLRPPLASRYTVVVKGHRVNVNAVNSHSNSIVQDYALVVASGNVAPSNAINLAVNGPVFTNDPTARIAALVPATTNGTTATLMNQRVGANSPLILSTNGATNQWAFFTYTNVTRANFTNVLIMTFFPPELSLPRLREADIDLYVSRGASTNLFDLDPVAVSAADKSLTRGGTEFLIFSNATPGEVFAIGVKSEDQQGASFGLFAASSDRPFSSTDGEGNIIAEGIGLPVEIPDGTPDNPGGTNIFIFVLPTMDTTVQRVYLTNSIYHEEAGDLIGILSHRDMTDGSDASVTLNNHRTWNGLETVVYDDSEQGDLGDASSSPPVIPPDGPGSLRSFVGQKAGGPWTFTISDNALFHTGSVQGLTLVIEPASTNDSLPVDLTRTIGPGRWVYAGFDVPADATNIQACVTYVASIGTGPVELYLRRGNFPTRTDFDKALLDIFPPGDCLDLGLSDSPPLSPGRYFVGWYNAGPDDARIRLTVEVQRGITPDRAQTISSQDNTPLIDDATTNSFIFVTNRGIVTSVEVDVRINHPRVSDLALHLRSPQGTRILLAENRGRDTTNGYGFASSNIIITNFGTRVLNSSFEGAGTAVLATGDIYDGWRIEAGTIEVLDRQPTRQVNAHTGTNIIDINGVSPGTISTNVVLVPQKTYLLTFAYSRNPDAGPAQAQVSVSNAAVVAVTSPAATTWDTLQWSSTSVVFRATTSVNRVEIKAVNWPQPQTGVLFDTVRIDEVELVTNSTLYATFTDDPAKAFLPIKFAPPPFGDTNFTGTNIFISGFEGTTGGVKPDNSTFVGWTVLTNTVAVSNNNALAYSDTNFLLLRTGAVSRALQTVIGKEYVLQFATKADPGLAQLFNTGVDSNRFLLPDYALDPHFTAPRSSFPNAPGPNVYVIPPSEQAVQWVGPNLLSQWVSPLVRPNINGPNGTVTYRTSFYLPGFPTTGTRIAGRWAVDNEASILLNGVTNGARLSGQFAYEQFNPFLVTNGFRAGTNILDFSTTNEAGFNGIRIEFEEGPASFNSAMGEVKLEGAYTNVFTALSDLWRTESVTFVARSTNTVLEFTGITPGVWLDHIQMRETGRKYYFPEEPLTPLLGEQAFGRWNLEVWDSRLGAIATGADLLSWRLNLTYVRTNPPIVLLTNAVPYIGTVYTNNLKYFVVNVPCATATVTNTLISLSPPGALDLLFNQDTYPTGNQRGDVALSTNRTSATVVLDVGFYPLLRAGPYYLAVRNTDPAQVNDFQLRVDIACSPGGAPFINIPMAASFGPNGFEMSWQSEPGAVFRVEYAENPEGPWTAFPHPITSLTGEFTFQDDGSQTGGLSPNRFYRLRRVESHTVVGHSGSQTTPVAAEAPPPRLLP